MKMMSWGVLLFLGLFFLVGLGMVAAGLRSVYKARTAAHWPVTSGVLESCELVEDSSGDGTTYRVNVRYAYEALGQPYRGERVAFGYSGSSGRASHEALRARLAGARSVAVRYNPARPAEAVLTYGVNRSNLILLVFGVTWLAFVTGFYALVILSETTDHAMVDRIEILSGNP